VRVADDGLRFAVDCDPFYVAGFNSYTLIEAAAEVQSGGSYSVNYTGGRQLVLSQLDEAQRSGLNVVRMWAFTVMASRPMQIAPGLYDEDLSRGLDFVLAAARARSIRVVLVLADWWTPTGGVSQYLKWSKSAWPASPLFAFYTDSDCRAMFKQNAAHWINRVNSINGITYKDDSTIFGWELLNEGRCPRGCGASMQHWIADMADYIAALDPHHLRSVGEEGFFSSNVQWGVGTVAEPGIWARTTGQSFTDDHAPAAITHATAHIWPQDWSPFAPLGPVTLDPINFVRDFITSHAKVCQTLRKPLIISEYGCSAGIIDSAFTSFTRSAFYATVHSAVEEGILAGLPIAGDLLWIWYAQSTRVADSFGVYTDQPVWQQIVAHASTLNALANEKRGSFCP